MNMTSRTRSSISRSAHPDDRLSIVDRLPHIFELDSDALQVVLGPLGVRSFVADQILEWVFRHGVTDPERMTNLSSEVRSALPTLIEFERGTVVTAQAATDGTDKILIEWDAPMLPVLDDASASKRRTETVMIPDGNRKTACVSSQIGCPVGCTFCASGIGGLDGNLTTGQIVEQIHHLRLRDGIDRITNIVFMGMGEPLANMTAVTGAIRILNAEWGFGIGARRITVSTVGLPKAISKFIEFELPVTLALSLHAPTDELRRRLIPWAEYSTVEELLAASQEWFDRTGREITLEYILIGGINDQSEHAEELARLAGRMRANVNLIRYNEVAGLPWRRPVDEDVRAFQRRLRAAGVNSHIRASRGRDIAAACGQLRHEASIG
jgi:23S rRNA (adenine2503-C2)-methyltransferase